MHIMCDHDYRYTCTCSMVHMYTVWDVGCLCSFQGFSVQSSWKWCHLIWTSYVHVYIHVYMWLYRACSYCTVIHKCTLYMYVYVCMSVLLGHCVYQLSCKWTRHAKWICWYQLHIWCSSWPISSYMVPCIVPIKLYDVFVEVGRP